MFWAALYLIEPYCLPSLTYSCQIWSLREYDAKRVDVTWNNAFRTIFNYHWYDSVKPLQLYCSCLPVSMHYVIYEKTAILEENVI